MSKMTMWQQYLSIKKNYADVILFFRLGDFYETFGDDAKLIAEVLDITLTVKALGHDQNTPMAGLPYHAVDSYLEQLVGKGYRVAICEQMDDFVHKTLQKREVVRVVTPGTLTNPTMLQAERNSYLVAVIEEKGKVGLAYADLTTGEFCATELGGADARKQLEGELVRLQAAEVLVADAPELRPQELEATTKQLEHDLAPMRKAERERMLPHERAARKVEGTNETEWVLGAVTQWPAWRWEARTAREALLAQFGAQSLDGYGLGNRALAARAAGALIQYLR
ncbi:MAG TPA: DNA mismatch repair protein MutS, partial [Herpetosiphonaceae bacterium]